jgi:hypothetical protein
VAVNVYVDGFNLFYGALRGSPHRWLDLGALCSALLPNDEIHRIRYFTARVTSRPGDPGKFATTRRLSSRSSDSSRIDNTLWSLSDIDGAYAASDTAANRSTHGRGDKDRRKRFGR